MEDDDPHQPQAPWPPRSKVTVASRDQSELSWPNAVLVSLEPVGAYRVGRTRRPHFLFHCTCSADVRYWYSNSVRPFVCHSKTTRHIHHTFFSIWPPHHSSSLAVLNTYATFLWGLLSFCLCFFTRWHVPPSRTSAEACLTGWSNARPQGWDKCSVARHHQACLTVCVKCRM